MITSGFVLRQYREICGIKQWVFNVNYFVPSTTIIIPERYHENDVTEGAHRATGATSFFQRFLTSFAISFPDCC